MSDMLDEDLEFRGGTLQLSTVNTGSDHAAINRDNETENSENKGSNPNPSVLSGANSLTSSSASFADARTPTNQLNIEPSSSEPGPGHPMNPRYELPFNRENVQNFFTFRKGVVKAAIQECITVLLFPEDGEYLGSWLLTEITLWDAEKERIVLLTSRLVMTIKYDFIAMKQLDFKKSYLDDLDTIVIGDLVYPPASLVPRLNGIADGISSVVKDCVIDRVRGRPQGSTDSGDHKLFDTKYFAPRERNIRGVRLMWNKGEALPLRTVWNPFTQDVPLLTFVSHPLFWHKDGTAEEIATYDIETFAIKLQRAIEAMPSSNCCIHQSSIVIHSYVGLPSLLHNKTSLGFFKVRGKISF